MPAGDTADAPSVPERIGGGHVHRHRDVPARLERQLSAFPPEFLLRALRRIPDVHDARPVAVAQSDTRTASRARGARPCGQLVGRGRPTTIAAPSRRRRGMHRGEFRMPAHVRAVRSAVLPDLLAADHLAVAGVEKPLPAPAKGPASAGRRHHPRPDRGAAADGLQRRPVRVAAGFRQ